MPRQRLTLEQKELYSIFSDEVWDHPRESFEKIIKRVFRKKKPFTNSDGDKYFESELKKTFARTR